MISVTRASTTGAVGRELMDTRYSAGKVASERREIHCKPSIIYHLSQLAPPRARRSLVQRSKIFPL